MIVMEMRLGTNQITELHGLYSYGWDAGFRLTFLCRRLPCLPAVVYKSPTTARVEWDLPLGLTSTNPSPFVGKCERCRNSFVLLDTNLVGPPNRKERVMEVGPISVSSLR